ncbi:MAG: hypothetical protein DHS20C18_45060 [Saprospiraceae bacterium]|nr:MAG: hypothetical protein DHS20C18_45060 [Saprospiraceae bacterium]
MDRREAIKRTALFTGYALSSSVIAGVMQGCQPEPTGPDWTPQFFTEEQASQVNAMVDVMLPPTATPGAVELGVPAFIDLMVKDWYQAKDQTHFLAGLEMVNQRAQTDHGKSFLKSSSEQQLAVMNAIDEDTRAKLKEQAINQSGEEENEDTPYWPFMHKFKNLALLGYFSSKKIGTEVLNYDPIPGGYEGCIPYEEGGAAWAL